MARALLLVVAAVGVSAGCGASTATKEQPRATTRHAETAPSAPVSVAVPDDPADRAIRRELDLAIAQDAQLKDRQISFIVSNGDVSVTGTVGTEEERRKINELAMNIGGVKSVANALRVEQQDEEATGTAVDPRKTGNKPRFDRDR